MPKTMERISLSTHRAKRKCREDLGLLLNEAEDTEHERGLGTECCLLLSFHEQALMNPSSERPGEKTGRKKIYLWRKLLKSTKTN